MAPGGISELATPDLKVTNKSSGPYAVGESKVRTCTLFSPFLLPSSHFPSLPFFSRPKMRIVGRETHQTLPQPSQQALPPPDQTIPRVLGPQVDVVMEQAGRREQLYSTCFKYSWTILKNSYNSWPFGIRKLKLWSFEIFFQLCLL